jgi:hypothetical protein
MLRLLAADLALEADALRRRARSSPLELALARY